MADTSPDSTPHPNPDRYESCAACDYDYKLKGEVCSRCRAAELPPASPEDSNDGPKKDPQ